MAKRKNGWGREATWKMKKQKQFCFQRKSLFWYQITDCDDIYHFYRQLFHERTTERIKPETNRFLLWLQSPSSHSLVARCAMCSLLALNKQCYYNAWRVMFLESTNWTKTFCTVETSQRMFSAHSMTQPVQSINIQNLLTHRQLKLFTLKFKVSPISFTL